MVEQKQKYLVGNEGSRQSYWEAGLELGINDRIYIEVTCVCDAREDVGSENAWDVARANPPIT